MLPLDYLQLQILVLNFNSNYVYFSLLLWLVVQPEIIHVAIIKVWQKKRSPRGYFNQFTFFSFIKLQVYASLLSIYSSKERSLIQNIASRSAKVPNEYYHLKQFNKLIIILPIRYTHTHTHLFYLDNRFISYKPLRHVRTIILIIQICYNLHLLHK